MKEACFLCYIFSNTFLSLHMYVYIRMYTYIRVYINTGIYIYTYIDTCICHERSVFPKLYIQNHVSDVSYVRVYIYTYMYTCTYTYMRHGRSLFPMKCILKHLSCFTYVCIYVYACTYIHIYTYMYIYILVPWKKRVSHAIYSQTRFCRCICMYIYIRVYIYTYIYIHICIDTCGMKEACVLGYIYRPRTFFEGRRGRDAFLTPAPLFCLICTIISNKTCILVSTRNPILSEPGSILVDGVDTRLIPRSCSCGIVDPERE